MTESSDGFGVSISGQQLYSWGRGGGLIPLMTMMIVVMMIVVMMIVVMMMDDNNDDDVARSGSKEEERSIEHDNFVLYESNITAAHNTDYYDAIDSEDSFDSESEDK
jgi:hypothetical protein